MARLELHELRTGKRAGELARLVEALAADGRRAVVWVDDEGRRQIFDDFLCTIDKLAFVPHVLWQPGLGEVDDPVVLVGEPANPNGATVLVVGDGLPPAAWARGFDEVHDLIPPGPDGDERRGWWQDWRGGAQDD
jgi:DNA polymerase IIIc chi subunit